MNYHEIPQELKYHLHALELREVYHYLRELNDDDTFTLLRLNKILFNAEFHPWTETVNDYLRSEVSKKQRRIALIPYYLVAGCGIIRICDLLRVGTARVYKVKNSLPSYNRPSPLAGAFSSDPDAINNLQHILDRLQIADGFRITKPERERHNPFATDEDDEK